jgi:hypothetical protein
MRAFGLLLGFLTFLSWAYTTFLIFVCVAGVARVTDKLVFLILLPHEELHYWLMVTLVASYALWTSVQTTIVVMVPLTPISRSFEYSAVGQDSEEDFSPDEDPVGDRRSRKSVSFGSVEIIPSKNINSMIIDGSQVDLTQARPVPVPPGHTIVTVPGGFVYVPISATQRQVEQLLL